MDRLELAAANRRLETRRQFSAWIKGNPEYRRQSPVTQKTNRVFVVLDWDDTVGDLADRLTKSTLPATIVLPTETADKFVRIIARPSAENVSPIGGSQSYKRETPIEEFVVDVLRRGVLRVHLGEDDVSEPVPTEYEAELAA